MPEEELYSFTSILEASTNKLWGCHFGVPDFVVAALSGAGEARRVVCTLNEKKTLQCALLPRGDGSFLITVNKKLRDQLGVKIGMKVQASLKKDESRYGLPMPEEMAEVLAQDEQANRLFHALTPGKQRTLLYIAGHVKNTDGRIARALAIAEHLKAGQGKIDYRQLNEDLKNNRR